MNLPKKLRRGDEVRIIAPSRSAKLLSEQTIDRAKKRLESCGLVVTFGKNVFENDLHSSSSIEQRLEDLHAAFADPNVQGILTAIGGYNSNELLPYIDYRLIAENPKFFSGYSDITALATAITVKTGLVTYSGAHFSSFALEGLQAYQFRSFVNAAFGTTPYLLEPAKQWSDDAWYIDGVERRYEPVSWKTYASGSANGRVYGGNLCTLNLLQGTPYFPLLDNVILFVEDDELTFPEEFARNLASLLQASGRVNGLVIGRFQRKSGMSEEQIRFILDKHPRLRDIPVLYDVDFGHTQPMFTFPIGGTVELSVESESISITVTNG